MLEGKLIEKETEVVSLSKWLCVSVASGKTAIFGEDATFGGFYSLLMAEFQNIKSNEGQLSIKEAKQTD